MSKGFRLGLLAALMIVLGYPGEIASSNGSRWLWWALAMIPFAIIVYELYVGLRASIEAQPASVKGLVSTARTLTIVPWCFYPVVFIFPMIALQTLGLRPRSRSATLSPTFLRRRYLAS